MPSCDFLKGFEPLGEFLGCLRNSKAFPFKFLGQRRKGQGSFAAAIRPVPPSGILIDWMLIRCFTTTQTSGVNQMEACHVGAFE